MGHSVFGWSYPPGCSGLPEGPEPHPKSEELYALLEEADVSEEIIEKACKIVEDLAIELDRECPQCLKAQAAQEEQLEREAKQYWDNLEVAEHDESDIS